MSQAPATAIVLVDDSIVRGTTLRKIVRMIRGAGAKEIHVRIGSPKLIGPCYYGIDTPTEEELIANRMTEAEICACLGADSLRYLTVSDLRGMLRCPDDYCFACFNREYMYPPERFSPKLNAP
jgi:amidophosphoribosyltransferase